MKIVRIVPFILVGLCLASCFEVNRGNPERHDIVYNNKKIDKNSLDKYFKDNEEKYPSYQELKGNSPDLLDHVKSIECGNLLMFRFSDSNNGFLDGATFLYDGYTYIQLGASFGGYGVTEFVLKFGDAGHWMYFLYSFGSGIHRTHIEAYEIITNQFYSFEGVDLGLYDDYTLVIDEDNNIDVYKAEITPIYDDDDFCTFDIQKGKIFIDNVDDYQVIKK